MHVWANAYRDANTALAKQLYANGETKMRFTKEEDLGYIDSLDFTVNGNKVKWSFLKDSIDICRIELDRPLASGDSLIIRTPFHIKIPSGSISRLGHIGQSYQITQWYPKPAVFDRDGWHQMPYLNQGEFYSEFGSYDVSITLPANYVLGATGDLVDGEKELEWLEEKVRSTEAVKDFDEVDNGTPASDSRLKTLRYRQTNVHDFAWFCDKRYYVLSGEVETPHSKQKVKTWAMFTAAEGNLWKKSITYINDAIYYYSLWNGDYPYKHCTAVDGTISAGGGMEYPNITVIGTSGEAFQLDLVIAHEVGHNWFYGMLASNERLHPWLDEGLNSYNENRYLETKYPDAKLIGHMANGSIGKMFDLRRYKHKAQYELSYLLAAKKNEDQPIEAPAASYTELNYGGIVYSKTALVFDYLLAYLGEQEMDKAMQAYFDEWKFKHPSPLDLRRSLEKSTGKDLSWLFNDLINSTKKLDYKIAFSHQNPDGSWDIGVKNAGEVKGPVIIQGIRDNKLVGEIIYDGFSGKQVLSFPASRVEYFQIDFMEDMPEVNRNNNIIRNSGIFRKVEPLKLQFLGSLDNPNKTQLFWSPVAGWNNYNRWMLGVALYNNILPSKKFEFELMPMYSYTTNDLAGYGKLSYNIYPDRIFQRVTLSLSGSRFAYENSPFDMNYSKVSPELSLELRKRTARSPITQTIRYRNISLFVDGFSGKYEFTPPVYSREEVTKIFHEISYTVSRRDALHPVRLEAKLQQGENMAKGSIAANYTLNFRRKNKGLDVRVFAGSFLGTDNTANGPYRFRMSGWKGYHDYLYDNVFLGRSETEGVLSAQMAEEEGAFKFYSPIGQSAEWLAALNVKSSIGTLPVPLGVYADIGTCGSDGLFRENVLYNAGLYLSFPKNIFTVYFPLLISEDMQSYKDANGLSYGETIRFTLNLKLLNPFDLVRNFEI
jgi:hypothetical protein